MAHALIDRTAAETLIRQQMNHNVNSKSARVILDIRFEIGNKQCFPWHYGRCELADLLNAIYGPIGGNAVKRLREDD